MTVRRYLAYVAALKDVPPARTKAAVALAMERAHIGNVRATAGYAAAFQRRGVLRPIGPNCTETPRGTMKPSTASLKLHSGDV